ncbi:TIGR00730 family Rossman fold protein [Pontibacter sp. JH31]|uniref:Cytokinin riboside 5'-monophosphate phosphoribohydrolase n=1 Tax=Pontibacter aquaedesilientis TaxID=2766980 RepID=A0ABR7XJY6_9BACT|nr:TIGR00730 family Rossman fold protein [Pontibacter aquaedesilientis]MBD1398575.1 TIGR00730 family Rossman fold protein [Pontibacter aquaedesilientis]
MRSIGVFCGANAGVNPTYSEGATKLGQKMAAQGIQLVYGGGNVGLMGIIADAVLAAQGIGIGVIPQSLVDREVAHTGLQELIVVESMHERKAIMAARSDAFVAMPGGFGTFDEICEIITWNQLGIIKKPVAFYNINGYWDKFFEMIDHTVAEGFVKFDQRENLIVESDPEMLLQKLQSYADATSDYWVDFKRI